MNLLLKDKLTNVTAWSTLDWSLFNWSENNDSCDCNRAISFPKIALKLENQYGNFCYGTQRFIAIDVRGDLEGHTKEEVLELVNQDYE